jgi:sulfhydrogenase subunit beta (sulfur reductase)
LLDIKQDGLPKSALFRSILKASFSWIETMPHSGFLARENLQQLIDVLQSQGYACVGPTVDNGNISYQTIDSIEQLPKGIEDKQAAGYYQLKQHTHSRYFAWANGSQAIKPLTFAPQEPLWRCKMDSQGNLSFDTQQVQIADMAIIGVRACDLAALQLQKQHFLQQPHIDPWFKQRLESLLIIAVHCSHPSANCFCHSTGDGPLVTHSYDLALHELEHGFVVDAATTKGQRVFNKLVVSNINETHLQEADKQIHHAISIQSRALPENDIKNHLLQQLDHPHWEKIGERCLACGNCTAVCPSCFCHQQSEELSLSDNLSTHYRQWSSCFNHDHGYLAGFNIRPSTTLRYRQWLTHKFANWHDQYGRSGCVGCGRCISWCPAGIDIIDELSVFCNSELYNEKTS